MVGPVRKKIHAVRWRMAARQFARYLDWSLTLFFSLGAVWVGIDKFFSIGIGPAAVLSIMAAMAILVAATWAWIHRPRELDAAIEFDRVFHLSERVSTLCSLDEEGRAGAAGQALARDLEDRVAAVHVPAGMPIALPRRAWAPLVPFTLLLCIGYLLRPFGWAGTSQGANVTAEERAKVVEEARLLDRKLAERQKELAKMPPDPELEKLSEQLRDAARKLPTEEKISPKEAALRLSDLAKLVEERRQQLDSVDSVKRQLAKLARVGDGPAEKMVQALKQGDFAQAKNELDALSKALKSQDMSSAERQKTAQQLRQIQKQLDDLARQKDRAEQQQKSLTSGAASEELKRLAEDSRKLDQLKKLAEQLGKCADCSGAEAQGDRSATKGSSGKGQPGKDGTLSDALNQAGKVLEELARDEQKLETLENMADDLGESRGRMCAGPGMGRGKGSGQRPEQETRTRSRPTQSKSQSHSGPIQVVGRAPGTSFKGQSRIELRAEAIQAGRAAEDAVTRQKVPAEYKDHAREYFERLSGSLKD